MELSLVRALYDVIAAAVAVRRSPPTTCSLCAFRAWPAVVSRGQVPHDAPVAKAGIPGVQRPHARARSLEVSVHGPASDGHRRLVGVREP